MEAPLLLQFSIALFTGMVAATLIPPVRRSIPRPVEVLLWLAFFVVCALGVLSITDRNARELSASAVWGADQMINAVAGLSLGGVWAWIGENRFPIASWMMILAGADLFLLVVLRSRRAVHGWQPRVRLREWMELPLPAMMPEPVRAGDPIAGLNRRVVAGVAVAGTTTLTSALDFSLWLRDVFVPRERTRISRAAQLGRTQSRSGLESFRDVVAHLQYAAHAWYAAAGQPAVSEVAGRANHALQQARQAQRARSGQVVDIQTLLNPQSIGWYGPLLAAPTTPGEGENDETEPTRPDRLAS
ncbi:MAG TPA: hypothetical protein VNA65_08975 [Candidatus Dormibacteraeota bacterium]|nr:hypothetical protein [Candidatus Dormibacteraeota bacterium]